MSKIRVLHYSTHDENCGIGKYQEQFIAAMKETSAQEVYNEFFPYSPNVTSRMNYDEFTAVLEEMRQSLRKFDLLHIQHEMSFYGHTELQRVITMAHEEHKKVLMTVHTAPDADYKKPSRNGFGPHSILAYLREKKIEQRFRRVHTDPMAKVDLILVHNKGTEKSLVKHGVQADRIQIITLPVPETSALEPANELRGALNYQEGDVLLGLVGFIFKTKGADKAVKALNLLPPNYKLALIGGTHHSGGGEDYLDEVTDLIVENNLQDRVYITGYVDDDDRLNQLVKEVDACVYPYDNQYYQYVSSAALNHSLANGKPTIAYPTKPFIEMNKDETIAICKSSNYYELARYIVEADYDKLARASKKYASKHSYPVEAKKLVSIYKKLLAN